MRKTLVVCGALASASSAFAQISPIGEFTGALSEGFEPFVGWSTAGGVDTLDVMGGGATFQSNPVESNQLWIYEPAGSSTWGLGANGFAETHSGAKGLGLFLDLKPVNVSLVFDVETMRFGGWFGTDSNNNNLLTVTFYDSADVQIGAVQNVSTNSSTLVWFGWQSAVGVKRVEFGNNWAPAMDDIQADGVPEPATILILAVGLVGLISMRRK